MAIFGLAVLFFGPSVAKSNFLESATSHGYSRRTVVVNNALQRCLKIVGIYKIKLYEVMLARY